MSQQSRWGLVAIAAVLALAFPPALAFWKANQDSPSIPLRHADFGFEPASPEARRLADGIARSGDNARSNFAIIDKKLAVIHVFDGAARLRGSSPILLGSAPGDETVPGIGKRPIAQVRPDERTTPAGRFVVSRGLNMRGEDVVWVSYSDALSMHPVLTTNADEHRLERLATPSAEDNRISYGCINIPQEFFEEVVRPAMAAHRSVVYILPEEKSVEQVFGSLAVPSRS